MADSSTDSGAGSAKSSAKPQPGQQPPEVRGAKGNPTPGAPAEPEEPKVRLKVEGPHESLTYGGLTVGTEFTEVPRRHLASMTQAAADSGVKLTQEE